MSGILGAVCTAYGRFDRFIHDPRLTKCAELGTVIPFLLLGILCFVFSAIVVPPPPVKRPAAGAATAGGQAESSSSAGEQVGESEKPFTASAAETPASDGKTPGEGAKSSSTSTRSEDLTTRATQHFTSRPTKSLATPRPPPSKTWRRSASQLGLVFGWAWWGFALILCVDYELKIILGTLIMLAFGLIVSIAVDTQLSIRA